MTVEATGGSAVVPYTGSMEGLGLEDVSASDLSVPRLNIIGKTAMFQNSQTKEQFAELNAILISQIKQRVMWNGEPDDKYKRPQCRSSDFETGFPNIDPKAPTHDGGYAFPWNEGNFDPAAGQQGLYLPLVKEQTGLPALPCASCKFKDWENGKTRCKEQHVYPLLYQDTEGYWVPAILTVQGSGIKASRTYVGSFATSRQPLFTVVTQLKLTPATRGSVDYAIPVFRKISGSDPAKYEEYATMVGSMRQYLRRWPTAQEDVEADTGIVEVPAASGPVEYVAIPTTAPAVAPSPPVPTPAPAPVVAPPAAVIPPPPAPVIPPPAAPPIAPPPVPVVPAPAPVAAPVEVIPLGYEAVWATMPPEAKQAILAMTAPPTVAADASPAPAAPVAPVAQPVPVAAPPATSGNDDLPF